MATERVLSFSVASVVEDVLHQHNTRSRPIDLASRKDEEASLRRYEAAGWLRKTVGVVGCKDLPAQPSEEEFRLGLRSGIILCTALNNIQPGAISKVVEGPCDSDIIPDGAALSAFQYFENVRNFLVAVEEFGVPAFEVSDFEEGGKSARIVNCVLALKSYDEWKQSGARGSWKYSGNFKPSSFTRKPFMRKNTEPFKNSFLTTSSTGEKSLNGEQASNGDLGLDLNEARSSHNLNILVRSVLSNKKQEEIPMVVESMLNKVVEEFERRMVPQNVLMRTSSKDMEASYPNISLSRTTSTEIEMDGKFPINEKKDEDGAKQLKEKGNHDVESETQLLKQHMLVEQQQRNIQELKETLHSAKSGMQELQMKYQEDFSALGKQLHGLAFAVSRYQKVLEENRKLYNQVQDLKGNIRVYCRVRPLLNGQPNCRSTVAHIEEGNISITTQLKYGKLGQKTFSFNKVFGPAATQVEVFSDTQTLIRSVLDGYNVCIFAYGQTGSGKTYTMTGPKELTEECLGVNYRALNDLFLLANQRKDTMSCDISMQMLEIYNEQVRDLLVTDGQNKRLEIRNNSQNRINVPDANLVPVSTTSDVLKLMDLGQKNRSVGATAMNDRSSRSHSCVTVHVQGRDLTSGTILRGSMHLVDLAGSERVDKSEVTGDRLKETQHINKSLSALGDVIASLAQKNSHVPYRNSKLTQLLQDSLGGQAKTLMFVHISPEIEALAETISTLKFAERVATVELGAARVNKESTEVKELKEQIASLKAALARKEEAEHLQYTRTSTPERSSVKSNGSSPSRSSWNSLGDISSNLRQSMEDVGNIQVQNQYARLRRKSLDPQLLTSSPPWTSSGIPVLSGKDDEKEFSSGDWVDKVMVNRLDLLVSDDNLLRQHELYNRQLPESFCQSYPRDETKIYPEQPVNRLTANKKDIQDYVQRSRYEIATTDESDPEAAASDCSEPDSLWQCSIPKVVSNIPKGPSTKTKKTPTKSFTRLTETRSLVPSLIPSPPTRRLSTGNAPSLLKPGRQPFLVDGKRKMGHAK
ncbi:kinesin-like protein KIN-14G [Mangifera indica]|uniref:kinesin-like protein KIN-14G n=1 Tax=Mangifera indica TaxID=29780 RepID=UPI001CFA3F09|nr:kinesin-like protein KIN-14G [Mangifera indica]